MHDECLQEANATLDNIGRFVGGQSAVRCVHEIIMIMNALLYQLYRPCC